MVSRVFRLEKAQHFIYLSFHFLAEHRNGGKSVASQIMMSSETSSVTAFSLLPWLRAAWSSLLHIQLGFWKRHPLAYIWTTPSLPKPSYKVLALFCLHLCVVNVYIMMKSLSKT